MTTIAPQIFRNYSYYGTVTLLINENLNFYNLLT